MNGVKLEEILKRKRSQEDKNVKNTTVKKTPGRRNVKKTMPSSNGKINTMMKYIVKTDSEDKKQEDNKVIEDNQNKEDKTQRQEPASLSPRQHHGGDTQYSVEKKLTFKTTPVTKKNEMNDKISRFQELVDRSQVCVTGSGRCARHNVRLVRDIVQKKQSFVKKCGGIGWRLCDFVILVCPTKLSSMTVTSDVNTKTSPNRIGATMQCV